MVLSKDAQIAKTILNPFCLVSIDQGGRVGGGFRPFTLMPQLSTVGCSGLNPSRFNNGLRRRSNTPLAEGLANIMDIMMNGEQKKKKRQHNKYKNEKSIRE